MIDASIGAIGSYLPTIVSLIESADGASLDGGILQGLLPSDNSSFVVADFAGCPGSSLLIGDTGSSNGDWVIEQSPPPSVPEPSSLVLCGIAGLVGWTVARSRRKRARSPR